MTSKERWSLKDWVQVVSAVMVPCVIAILGWHFQSSWNEINSRRDYAKLAVEILAAKDMPPALCNWAVDLLVMSDPPVPISLSDRAKMKTH